MKDGYYRIKTWEQMEGEFGPNSNNVIHCASEFTVGMEETMPNDRVIKVINDVWHCWYISQDMVAEYLGETMPTQKIDLTKPQFVMDDVLVEVRGNDRAVWQTQYLAIVFPDGVVRCWDGGRTRKENKDSWMNTTHWQQVRHIEESPQK